MATEYNVIRLLLALVIIIVDPPGLKIEHGRLTVPV